jgi:hypothetical protein
MVRVAKTGYLVAAGIAIAAALGAYVLFNSIAGTGGATQTADGNVTSVAADQPALQLVLLAGPEDGSTPVAQYSPNNNETITLHSNAHLRFESPDTRPPDSLRIVAHDVQNGSVFILRKSYDVNNEFFVNLEQGKYELRAEASWADKGPFLYTYDIAVI